MILDELIRSDEGKTGRSLPKRKGLLELVALAGRKPRPYDVLIFHSSSRMGRNLSDTLPLIDELLFYEVELYFVDTALAPPIRCFAICSLCTGGIMSTIPGRWALM